MRDNQRINQLQEYLDDEYSVYCMTMEDEGITPLEYDDWESGTDYLDLIKSELKELMKVEND